MDRLLDARAVRGDHPYDVEVYDSLGSTNDRAAELARNGRRDVAVLAAEQTDGRGRRDRSWVGPPGGLYLSVVVEPPVSPADYPLATLAAGVAVVHAVAEVTDLRAGVKWPNDVVLDGRKLAGVLTERVDGALVVGVGVNVAVAPEDLPEGAASLDGHLGALDRGLPAEPRERVARALLESFASLLADPDEVLPVWRDVADTLGRRVRVETPGGTVIGEAVDVERPGRLVVRRADGDVRIDAGDCEHLRAADD